MIKYQVAALPFRFAADGKTEVLLVTSRDTGRWLIPKGNPVPGLSPHGSAAHEAYEEAGVEGDVAPAPIGDYRYGKRRSDGTVDDMRVEVYPLAVGFEHPDWPERHQRERAWFSLAAAAARVDEPDLRALVLAFRPAPTSSV